ncbi:hypothetical protein ACIBF6_20905 [Streptosporangium amethystogenes]|uniref:hypothetical protein n=1 Tax=Streptosporangium amethystogenes TaxID=2002 RepID=UPI0037B4C061
MRNAFGELAAWLDGRKDRILELPEPLRGAAKDAVYQAEQAAKRIRDGIEPLTDPEYAADASATVDLLFF